MLLVATCRKLRPVLYLDPFTATGIWDHILKTLTPYESGGNRSIGKWFTILNYLLTIQTLSCKFGS
jgi:hypothetical protein